MGIEIDVLYLMDHRSVYIAKRIIIDEIAESINVKFLAHQLTPLRAYTFEVFDGGSEEG